jgi:hypothetical protein
MGSEDARDTPLLSVSVVCTELEFMGLFELLVCYAIIGFDSRVRSAEFNIYVYVFQFIMKNYQLTNST